MTVNLKMTVSMDASKTTESHTIEITIVNHKTKEGSKRNMRKNGREEKEDKEQRKKQFSSKSMKLTLDKMNSNFWLKSFL